MAWRMSQWRTDYGSSFRNNLRIPSISKSALIFILLLVVLFILAYINFNTGSYVAVLEENKTVLLEQLSACNNQTKELTSGLNTCEGDLNECNTDLSSKSSSLSVCQDEKSSISSSLSSCESDLNEKEDDLNVCESDLNEKEDDLNVCQGDLKDFQDYLDDNDWDDLDDLEDYINDLESSENSCQDDLSTCNSNLNAMKTNYVRDYCCLKLNRTSGNNITYSISNNRITCNVTGGTTLTC